MLNAAKLVRYCFLIGVAILIFLIPSNLFIVLSENFGYVTGLRVDYLLPKLYLTDLEVWLVIGLGFYLWWIEQSQSTINNYYFAMWSSFRRKWGASSRIKLLILLSWLLIVRQLFSPHLLISGWFTLQLLTALLLGWVLIANHRLLLDKKLSLSSLSRWSIESSYSLVWWALVATIIFQTTVALIQFWTQSSVWGYAFLGEVSLTVPYGIAHANLGGREVSLAYGTTAHPNVLAGVVVVYTLISWRWLFVKTAKQTPIAKLIGLVLLICTLIVIYITQSLSALLTLAIGSWMLIPYLEKLTLSTSYSHTIKTLQQLRATIGKHFYLPSWLPLNRLSFWLLITFFLMPIIVSVFTKLYPENLSLARRAWLNHAALQIFIQQPLVGTGLNLFTTQIKSTLPSRELVRFAQPAHHLGLLWLAETGFLGVCWIIALYANFRKKICWQQLNMLGWMMLPIAALDHYLLTLQTGRLLSVVLSVIMIFLLGPSQKSKG